MKQFTYPCHVRWAEGKKGVLSVPGKVPFEFSAPPEFKGPEGFLSPEDLLVAAVNSCFMLTFLFFVNKEGVELKAYESDAEGILDLTTKSITDITLNLKISLAKSVPREEIDSMVRLSEQGCFISNSVKAKLKIISEVNVTG